MLIEYIQAALEECRRNLEEVIDEWIVFRLKRGLMLPPIGNHVIKDSGEIAVA